MYISLALIVAFLAEIIVSPMFSKTHNIIEYITIVYYLVLLRTSKILPVSIASIVLLIADSLSLQIVGLQSALLIISSFCYNVIFVASQQRLNPSQKKENTKLSAISANTRFTIVFFIITILQTIAFQLLGTETTTPMQAIYFALNIFIFFILSLCL